VAPTVGCTLLLTSPYTLPPGCSSTHHSLSIGQVYSDLIDFVGIGFVGKYFVGTVFLGFGVVGFEMVSVCGTNCWVHTAASVSLYPPSWLWLNPSFTVHWLGLGVDLPSHIDFVGMDSVGKYFLGTGL
jgi:hypothetical protein